VSMVIKFWFSSNVGNFLTGSGTLISSKRNILHRVSWLLSYACDCVCPVRKSSVCDCCAYSAVSTLLTLGVTFQKILT
jgi:hypothetical protein